MIKQDRLAVLNLDVATALIQGAPLREVLLHCSEAFVRHLDAAFARIWTYNKEENVLELQASAGMYTHIDGSHSRVPFGQFKIGLIAEERKPHLTNAVIGDPRVHDQEWAKREGMAAFAGYPLVVEDRLVGVMAMFSCQELSEATLQAMGTVAKQIALGIDQKQAEETLQESEKRFRQLAEHIREVFWCCNTDGHEVVYVSPAYEEIWGRTCQSLYAQPTNWIDAIHADDREQVSEAFFRKASQGNFDEKYRIVRPDGTIRWIRDRGFPVEDESGRVYRIAGIAENITDRILAEEALHKSHDQLERRVQERTNELHIANASLKESQRKYLELYDNAPDMFASVNQKTMLITQCNQTLAKQLGYASEEIIGRPVIDLYHPDCMEGLDKAFELFAKTGEIRNAEFQLKQKDGTKIDVMLSVSAIRDKQGSILYSNSVWRDITARKLADEQLWQSERFARSTMDALTAHICVLDSSGTILTVNQSWRTFADSNPPASNKLFEGANYLDVCDNATGDCTEARMLGSGIRAVIHGDKNEFSLEYPCHSSTEKRWFLANVTRFSGAGPVRVVVIHENITKLKHAEETLVEQAHLHELGEDVGVALTQNVSFRDGLQQCTEAMVRHLDGAFARIWSLNEEQKILELEASAGLYTKIDGAHSRVSVGQFKIGLIAKEGKPHLSNDVMGDPLVHDHEWAKREGMVAFAGYPLIVEDRVVGVVAMFARHQLTDAALQAIASVANTVALTVKRKRVEEQIVSLAKFPEENPNPVMRIDKNGIVIYSNEASRVLLQKWVGAVGSRIKGPLLEIVSETLASGSNRDVDVQYGERFYSFDVTPIKDSNYVNLYGRDITDRKRAEENVKRQTEELTRSNAELEQYAYIASHDLQEPLRGVAGCLRILERRYTDALDASAHELITHAVDGACRMQALIEDLLRYSKVGTRNQHFEPTDCARILTQTLTALHAPIQEAGAVITYDTLPEVSCDPTQLMQVFQNLISNALKFRRDVSPRIHVGAKRRDREWVLWVQDNGIGIKPEYAERIFVLFQRLHTRAKYSGTGIGLAICKKIVERHHGRIWFESDPGKGTTFFFTIPL